MWLNQFAIKDEDIDKHTKIKIDTHMHTYVCIYIFRSLEPPAMAPDSMA